MAIGSRVLSRQEYACSINDGVSIPKNGSG